MVTSNITPLANAVVLRKVCVEKFPKDRVLDGFARQFQEQCEWLSGGGESDCSAWFHSSGAEAPERGSRDGTAQLVQHQ